VCVCVCGWVVALNNESLRRILVGK
jgi:hypothetical protein